jgi:adenylate cyclase
LRSKYKLWKSSDGKAPIAGIPSEGSLILVGTNASGVGDAGPTPFGRIEPLFVLHATALNDLIQNKLLAEASNLGNAVWAVAALLVFTFICRGIRTIPALFGLSAGIIVLALTVSGFALFRENLVLSAVNPAALLGLCLLTETGRRSGLTSLQKMRLRTTLGRYFSPRVLEDVLCHPDVMQPREAEITVLLTDLRNFTTITERLGTQRMFDLLNDVFEIETGAVISFDGSMEHFVGDQFLAYWGAPRDQPDASDRAMQAGAMIIKKLDALHASLPDDVIELFGYGLAIHRGKALIGNKGSRLRLDYGILGDIVNGAARVESLTKLYGVRQIITREVLDCIANKPECRFLDRVRVKGKTKPLELYEVLINTARERLALRDCYEKAWMLYERGDFPLALSAFAGIKETDRASQLLWKRCEELIAASPSSWDGAYQLAEK